MIALFQLGASQSGCESTYRLTVGLFMPRRRRPLSLGYSWTQHGIQRRYPSPSKNKGIRRSQTGRSNSLLRPKKIPCSDA
jgi:hypothetical protein